LALVLRLGWGMTRASDNRTIDALPDQREYLSIAQNILNGQGAHFVDLRFDQVVYAYRMPGYSWLIALCGCAPGVVRVVQAGLDTSTVLAVFLIARRLVGSEPAGEKASLIAAGLMAVNPFLIFFSGLILSETLFTAMLAWGMLALLSPAQRDWRWIFGVILLAISIYVRPSALLLAVVLAIGSGGFVLRGWLRGAVAAAVIFAALLPWAWRNSRPQVVEEWIWTTTNEGITAYDGWNPAATGGSDQSFISGMPELRGMGEAARSRYLAGRAREFVLSHPGRAMLLSVMKFGRLWSPVTLSERYSSPAYRAVALVYCVPFDLLVLAGLIRGRLTRTAKMFLLLPAIYFTLVHMASVGSLRYLLPAIPPMGVVAGSVFLSGSRSQSQVPALQKS
jgi:hypothetical protein